MATSTSNVACATIVWTSQRARAQTRKIKTSSLERVFKE